jgi:arsenite-transporting ATPase
MRIITYLGKGGVGKTSVSSATAVRIARSGKKVLVMSTDIAHSLADALNVELSDKPIKIEENLYGMEINILAEIRTHWSAIQSYFATMLKADGANEIVADELAIIPGMEEMISLKHLWEKANSGEYDVIIIDAAPTGETMRLLSMPDSYQFYTGRIAPWHVKGMKIAEPFLKRMMPTKNIFNLMPEVGKNIKDLHKLLLDPEISSYRIVVNPENMVIKEALRAETYLNLFGYKLDAVVCNKVLPASSDDPYLQGMINQQQKYKKQINDYFAPLPIFTVPQFAEEMIGMEKLFTMSQSIFGQTDPSEVLYTDKHTQHLEKQGKNYLLRLYVPNIEIDRVQMNMHGDELMVEVNNFRKNIVLPNVLIGRKADNARFENGTIEILFS